jgi:RNA polymerase sigma-70 factor (ECF subfamily)
VAALEGHDWVTKFDGSDDATLVASIARHDRAAFAAAIDRHRGAVLAFARRMVSDDERAEEVTQEVFLRLWQQPERFDAARGALRSFLFAQVHSRSLDVLRADSARRRREERVAHEVPDVTDEVEDEVVSETVAAEVRAVLAELPDAERQPIELAYFGELSYRAVAAQLGLPEGTVKSRIRVGLSKLRKALAERELAGP